MELLLLKLGGSLITHKTNPFTAHIKLIERICGEVKSALNKNQISLIIGNGGGSFSHTVAKRYNISEGIVRTDSWNGFVETQEAGAQLNRIVVHNLIKKGVNAISVAPSSLCIAENSKIIYFFSEMISRFLKSGLVPVVYGDVAIDTIKGCCTVSTEEVLGYLAKSLGGERIILVGEEHGILLNQKHPKPEMIERITPENFGEIKHILKSSSSANVTESVLRKVEKCLELTRERIECEIINGNVPGIIERAICGERNLGTLITR